MHDSDGWKFEKEKFGWIVLMVERIRNDIFIEGKEFGKKKFRWLKVQRITFGYLKYTFLPSFAILFLLGS